MRYKLFVTSVFMLGTIWLLKSCTSGSDKTEEASVKEWYNQQSDTLLTQLDTLIYIVQNNKNTQSAQAQFANCRFKYKKIEALVEYYFQGLNRRINGPALPDIKTDDSQVWPPHGFQVIEQYLYPVYNDSLQTAIVNEINLLKTDLLFAKKNMAENSILPRHLQEIIQHQLIRIATLGVTGFDAPLSKLSLQESAYALEGLEAIISVYQENKTKQLSATTKQSINAAIKYLQTNNDFDTFNRMQFLQQHLMPLSVALENIPEPYNTADSVFKKPFKGTLHSLVTGKAFNPDYYSSIDNFKTNPTKIALGKALFYDPLLSANKTLSCGSCHKPELYFTDHLTKAVNFVHGGNLARNTPTLYYASLQSNQFYDLRATYLEDQINEVMTNTEEFDLNSKTIAQRISSQPKYQKLFKNAFNKNDSIDALEVRNAIAAYIRSLNPFKSKFDAYLQGDKTAMNATEIQGFNVFMGKAKCGTCHFMPIFNGNTPPWFSKSESEIIGVPSKAVWQNATIDGDMGRYYVNKIDELKFAFKTPTIRNIEKTAPYMHNGVYKSLDEVVNFYQKGGGVGLGIQLSTQSLPFDSLSLIPNDKLAIIAFMKSLTDKL